MPSKGEIKALKRRRDVICTSLSRLHTKIHEFNNDTSIELINVKNERLLALLPEFNEVQNKLEEIDESDSHEQVRFEFEDNYDELRAKLQQLLSSRNTDASSGTSISTESVNSNTTSYSLPKIRLPEFSGDVTQFMHFHDLFDSLILQNQSLSNVERFHYLMSALRGNAHQLIQNIPVTADNFDLAWETVCKRYRNAKVIVNAHIKLLLSPEEVQKESASSLRTLLNQVQSNLKAVESLNLNIPLHEIIISQLILDKLPDATRKQWEMSTKSKEVSTLTELLDYLERRAQTLELIDFSPTKGHSERSSRGSHDKTSKHGFKHEKQPWASSSYIAINNNCQACKGQHSLFRCDKFLGYDVQRRHNLVKQHKLCYNCLRDSHSVGSCPSKSTCKTCNAHHNTLLHFDSGNQQVSANSYNSSKQEATNKCSTSQSSQAHNAQTRGNSSSYCTMKLKPQTQVLLSTAVVKVRDNTGRFHLARCLLDSGSQSNFVSESLVQTLGLRKTKNLTPIEGISQSMSEAKYSVSIEVQSNVNNTRYNVECLVLSKITSDMPCQRVPYEDWGLPNDIQLADPKFYDPAKIDMLLGADIFFRILQKGHMTKPGKFPVLQNTDFGWILSGSYDSILGGRINTSGTFFLRSDVQLHNQVQRFWEVEELHEPVKTQEELECENHFSDHVSRDATGRYVVRLPFRQDPTTLGKSLKIATDRFQRLELRLRRDEQLRVEYNKFMSEYEELGHMQPVTAASETSTSYYIPHHPVFKTSSSTTKTRVVFDASCKTSSGMSLNDILMTGPTIQQDLCSIVARFRTHPVCFTADIEKMYRQIHVHETDRNVQRILWRPSSNEPIKEYQLNTVTYGTSSAPFLAVRCLQQLAEDEKHQFPNAAKILLRDFYVDDCISGVTNVDDAIIIQKELIGLLSSGGFRLRKWCSNHPALLQAVPEDYRETQLPLTFESDAGVKTLGLLWHPSIDRLQIAVIYQAVNFPVTKRKVLSVVSSVYDPLGLISPFVVALKMFLQRLWQENTSWDEELPDELVKDWDDLYSQIPLIKNICIERLVLCNDYTQVQLHGFADASMKGYGACLYIRSSSQCGRISTHLLCAKSRVAPLKQITLPRLELCAAVLLSRLVKKMIPVLSLNFHSIHLWTDSKIVLSWISSPPSRWKTFVANRVAEIQGNTSNDDWKHVASASNPADIVSRGTNAANLGGNDLWWHGPIWLQYSESHWPVSTNDTSIQVPEQRNSTVSFVVSSQQEEITSKFSSYSKLLRVLTYCFRFSQNARCISTERKHGPLTTSEIQQTNLACIKLVQSSEFYAEISDLSRHNALSRNSKLRSLVPFIDNNGILRVGGRLNNSTLSYDFKHQIILPSKHHFTDLLIKSEHERLLHAGNQLTLATIRQRYWIVNGRTVIRRVINRCIKCYRFKITNSQQLMGQLPSVRTSQTRPFLNTGTDFTGPFYLKTGNVRSKTYVKGYICIFICMSTKAIHLEVVTDLTTGAFLAALKRFIARRGICCNMYSDNGTNFVGASRELKELRSLFELQKTKEELVNFATSRGFNWHFIPPHAPNFGGLWEAGVKSLKHHLRRVMGTLHFTYEELLTVVVQIEACLNSRPLLALSTDPSDLTSLTPAHFLIGSPLTALPEPDLLCSKMPLLTRYKVLQQRLQLFWKRWSGDYLTHLQQRSKWTNQTSNIRPGTIVLVKDDNNPPLQWPLGVVERVHPGNDDVVRVVSVRFKNDVFKRPVSKLAPLPISE